MHPAVVVSAHSRPASLARILGSLDAGVYPGEVRLVVSIDGGGDPEVQRVAEKHSWPHGPKRLIVHPERLGLAEHLRRCGDLSQEYGSIVLLEDDL
jgi:hypothetical protein